MHLIYPSYLFLLGTLSKTTSKTLNQINISKYDFVLQGPHGLLR